MITLYGDHVIKLDSGPRKGLYEPASEFLATSFFGNGTKVNAMCWPTKVAFLIFFEVHGIFKLRPDLSTWLGV